MATRTIEIFSTPGRTAFALSIAPYGGTVETETVTVSEVAGLPGTYRGDNVGTSAGFHYAIDLELSTRWHVALLNVTDTYYGRFEPLTSYLLNTTGIIVANCTQIEGVDATDQLDAHTASGLDAAGVRAAVGLASANLDTQLGAIDDFLDAEIAAIKAKTDNLPTDPADQSAVEAAITAATSPLATSASLATVQADTDDIQTRLPAALVGGRMDASVGAMAANTLTASALATDAVAEIQSGLSTQASVDDLPTNAELATALGTSDDATLAAIAALNNLSAAQVATELATYDAPTNAEMVARTLAAASYATAANQTTINNNVLAVPGIITVDHGAGSYQTATGFATVNPDNTTISTINTKLGTPAVSVSADIAAVPTAAEIDTQLSGTHGVGLWGNNAGTGARTVTITIDDGTDPLENARVRMTNGAETYSQLTNASGVATFSLDDATWTVTVTKALYTLTPTTIVVNGTETATYSMTGTVITPSDPGETTGYLTIRDMAGIEVEWAVVDVEVTRWANGTTGSGITPRQRSRMTDANGYVEFTGLPRLATYRVRVEDGEWTSAAVTADAATTPLVAPLGPLV